MHLTVPLVCALSVMVRADDTTCGRVEYTRDAIETAAEVACRRVERGTTVGSNQYPHRFNNREGFDFVQKGPYQIFPILSNGREYSGGNPGADRVVITEKGCDIVGQITHSGVQSNQFDECRNAITQDDLDDESCGLLHSPSVLVMTVLAGAAALGVLA